MTKLQEFYEPHQKSLQDLREMYPGTFYETEDNRFQF
eukprot:CAMPEP_0197542260 /NCGR_PEP_ID=MMETSP1318-20131121/67609_1 /TAXON_ID=552666 /ORGANISM="Partenskyella glossopodia, Strain RCC365" /LENGTH=36 /DNA_ID= /DNA_START= /DNA_END= /DNA_ORIENTATION=